MKLNIILLFLLFQFAFNAQVVINLNDIEVNLVDGIDVGQKNLARINTGKSDLEKFYHGYFYSANIETYKTLYQNPSEVNMTQSQYDNWKVYMKKANLKINGAILIFKIDDELFSALPYYEAFEYYNQYHVKLAKYNGARWVAMPTEEFRRYSRIKTLLTRIRPSYLLSLLKRSDANRTISENKWRTNSNVATLTEMLSQRELQYLNNLASRNGKNDIYMSNLQWTKKGSSKFQKIFKLEIESYLVDLNISPIDRQKIIHLFSLGEQHPGYTMIEELTQDDNIYLNDHVEFLKELFARTD